MEDKNKKCSKCGEYTICNKDAICESDKPIISIKEMEEALMWSLQEDNKEWIKAYFESKGIIVID